MNRPTYYKLLSGKRINYVERTHSAINGTKLPGASSIFLRAVASVRANSVGNAGSTTLTRIKNSIYIIYKAVNG